MQPLLVFDFDYGTEYFMKSETLNHIEGSKEPEDLDVMNFNIERRSPW